MLCPQVACGFRHSALVTASGLVLTIGHGETGRLGHGDEEDALEPKVRQGGCLWEMGEGKGKERVAITKVR